MIYIDHKGGIVESHNTLIHVRNLDEIKEHLNKSYNEIGVAVDEVKKDEHDECCYILQRFKGSNDFTVAGYLYTFDDKTDTQFIKGLPEPEMDWFTGKKYDRILIKKCTCKCHSDPTMTHIVACCNDGYMEEPLYID